VFGFDVSTWPDLSRSSCNLRPEHPDGHTEFGSRCSLKKRKSLPLQNQTSGHVVEFFALSGAICGKIEFSRIEALAVALGVVRERGGRLFMLGVGGSAGNCSHAVNDFRKLCDIEA
jgi:hypothetical protein